MRTLFLSAFLSIAAGVAAAEPPVEAIVGYDRFDVAAAHRAPLIAASIWHPAANRSYPALLGDNPVFKGVRANVGAAVADGTFPVFLLSHGSGGNMDGLGWLSSLLAARGAMVLAVNHPGSTSGDSSPRRSMRLDERAKDLSAALDVLLNDPSFGPHVDPARIYSLGFSLGGATALNLAGLRFDRAGYAGFCETYGEGAQGCAFLRKGGVDLNNLPEGFAADMKDPRVAGAIAIDPGFTDGATQESAAAMAAPVLLINLGEADRWRAVDVGPAGSDLAARLPNAAHEVLAPAWHFTFLGACKPEAAAMLAEEGDDPVCSDPEGADRAAIHRAIVEAVARFAGL